MVTTLSIVLGVLDDDDMRRIYYAAVPLVIIGLVVFLIYRLAKGTIERGVSSGIRRAGSPPATNTASPRRPADGPGRYRVTGVRRDGTDTTVQRDAASAANARVKAELQGIIPTDTAMIEDQYGNRTGS